MKIISFYKLSEEDIADFKRIQSKKEIMKQLPEHLAGIEEQMNEMKKALNALSSENASLKNEIKELNTKIEKSDGSGTKINRESIDMLTMQNASLTSRIAAAEENIRKSEIEKKNLKDQLNKMTAENTAFIKRLSDNEAKIGKLLFDDNEHKRLHNTERTTLNNERHSIMARLSDCESKVARLLTDNGRLFEQVRLLNSENQSQNAKIQNIDGKVDTNTTILKKVENKAASTSEVKINMGAGASLEKAPPLTPNPNVNVSPAGPPGFVLKTNNTVLEKYTGINPRVIIPVGVKTISNSCFENNKGIESIAIPEGVESIGEMAFRGCEKLKEVILPKTVKHLGNRVFANCTNLESVVIPISVVTIPVDSFEGSSKVTIKCANESTAEKFALRSKIPYVITFHKDCAKCGYSTAFLDKKKCPICGSKDWKQE